MNILSSALVKGLPRLLRMDSYQQQQGQSSCASCPVGKFQRNWGRSYCDTCHIGSITNTGSTAGAMACTACAAGKYSTASNVAACIDCEAGKYIESTGSDEASDCGECPPGSVTNTGAAAGANAVTRKAIAASAAWHAAAR